MDPGQTPSSASSTIHSTLPSPTHHPPITHPSPTYHPPITHPPRVSRTPSPKSGRSPQPKSHPPPRRYSSYQMRQLHQPPITASPKKARRYPPRRRWRRALLRTLPLPSLSMRCVSVAPSQVAASFANPSSSPPSHALAQNQKGWWRRKCVTTISRMRPNPSILCLRGEGKPSAPTSIRVGGGRSRMPHARTHAKQTEKMNHSVRDNALSHATIPSPLPQNPRHTDDPLR